MELKEGMYVRTYKGIRKIVEVVEDNNYYIDKTYINDFRQEIDCITNNCIIGEPSYNIIDLIEVGDYVNGFRIIEIFKESKVLKLDSEEVWAIDKNEIKSIVTKEQFESMEYKVC